MPNKSFSFYPPSADSSIEKGDQLILEIGKSFIAAMHIKENRKSSAFELFTFTEIEAEQFRHLFSAILLASKVLENRDLPVKVYINNEVSLLVPIFKFNKEIAEDYLNVVFGEDGLSKIQYEHIPVDPGMMNVYRVSDDCFSILNEYFATITFRHSWSNTIRTLIANSSNYSPEFISVQFYNTYITVVVMKNKNIHLIQSFIYENSEDVLYYLLNVADRFQLFSSQLQLQISGMIDLDFKLYRELIKYFKHVTVENADKSKLLLDIHEHPLHYFTPFFNLPA